MFEIELVSGSDTPLTDVATYTVGTDGQKVLWEGFFAQPTIDLSTSVTATTYEYSVVADLPDAAVFSTVAEMAQCTALCILIDSDTPSISVYAEVKPTTDLILTLGVAKLTTTYENVDE
mgnify:CR=1 FL=1